MKRLGLLLLVIVAVGLLVSTVSSQPKREGSSYLMRRIDKFWRSEFDNNSTNMTFPVDPGDAWTRMVLVPEGKQLTIPTSTVGDNEGLHPSIVKAPHGWPDDPRTANTKAYWIVMTPFNAGDGATIENPEIFHSDDGITWTVPTGLTNPIAPSPTGAPNNSDPHLIIHDSTMICYWRDNVGGTINLRYKTSKDGVNWSSMGTVTTESTYVTAPVIRNVRGVWHLWYLDTQGTGGHTDDKLAHETASSPFGPFSGAEDCTLNGISNAWVTHYYWHGDIRYVNGTFACLASFNEASWSTGWLFGTSPDGLTWEFDVRPNQGSSYDCRLWRSPTGHIIVNGGAYMPTMLWNERGNYWDVWLSFIGSGPTYWITKAKMFSTPNANYSFDAYDEYFTILYEDGNLEGFWPFIQSGGTTIYDYSGNDHDLTASKDFGSWDTLPTLQNPVHTVAFDGVDEEADIADNGSDFTFISGGNDVAFSALFWIKVGDITSACDIISKHDSSDQEYRIVIETAEKLRIWCFDESGGATAYEGRITDAGLVQNAWHFCVVTVDATQGESKSDGIKWYVDGSLVASSTNDGAGTYVDMEDLTAPLTIAHALSTGSPISYFVGESGPLALVQQEMSAVEIYRLWLLGCRMLNLPNARNLGE